MRKHLGVWLMALLVGLVPFLAGATPPGRTAVGGRFGLEIDGVLVGWLDSVEGGYATADVVTEKMGPDHIARKHLAGVKYENITMTFGEGVDALVLQWIQRVLDGKVERKSGSIIYLDREGREASRLNFANAIITEVGFPALDAASKDAAKMTIKIAPEYTRRAAGSGKPVQGRTGRPWLPSNFRLRIDGLDSATQRVNKVEAIVVKQKFAQTDDGQDGSVLVPAGIDISNLAITAPESSADPIYQWHEDFVIKGNNGQELERSGSLELLAPDMRTVLLSLHLQGLGIFRAEPITDAGAATVDQVEAEMYVNGLQVEQP